MIPGRPQVIQASFLGNRLHIFARHHHTGIVQPDVHGPATQLPPAVLNLRPRGAGQRLPEGVQRKMEGLFKTSFSDVRVHVGPEASAIGAVAFTHGSDLYFAHGQYNPNSPHGLRLIGHELTHVLQQKTGRVRNPFGSGIAVVQDPGLEAEAERMGIRAAAEPAVQPRMEPGNLHRSTVQRKPELRWNATGPAQRISRRPSHAVQRAVQPSVIQRVKAYRVQGGSGFESQSILQLGGGRYGIPHNQQHKQFNIAVGDILHSIYYLKEKRGGLGDIYEFDLDDTLFNTWIIPASIPQHHASTNPHRLWKPPQDAISRRLAQEFLNLVEPRLREKVFTQGKSHEEAKQEISAEYEPFLGPWAEGPIDPVTGDWPTIQAPRIGDTDQPSYKVEAGPPWLWILSFYIGGNKPALTGHKVQKRIPQEVKDPAYLLNQIDKLLTWVSIQVIADSKVVIRQLTKLKKQVQEAMLVQDDDVQPFYQEFARHKRNLLPPTAWFVPLP
jgi:hypothetical protein